MSGSEENVTTIDVQPPPGPPQPKLFTKTSLVHTIERWRYPRIETIYNSFLKINALPKILRGGYTLSVGRKLQACMKCLNLRTSSNSTITSR